MTGPAAWQLTAPLSYSGLLPVTVYTPAGTRRVKAPSLPTRTVYESPAAPRTVTVPSSSLSAGSAEGTNGPPTASNDPVTLPHRHRETGEATADLVQDDEQGGDGDVLPMHDPETPGAGWEFPSALDRRLNLDAAPPIPARGC